MIEYYFLVWVTCWVELCEAVIGILTFGTCRIQISSKLIEWRILRSIGKILKQMRKKRLKDKKIRGYT
jgi:hypothetical protein